MIPDPELNIWEHSATARELYVKRARGEAPEMDCAAQCADTLAPYVANETTPPRLLDAGCGTGYLWRAFERRGLDIDYHGLDYSPTYIDIARRELPRLRFTCGRLEDLRGERCDLVALVNTLTFCADFREPLCRLAGAGPRVMLIRDNFGPATERRWEVDGYLDEGYNHLKGYWNRWGFDEVSGFLGDLGYECEAMADWRAKGGVEMVVDKPYYWSWLLARRRP